MTAVTNGPPLGPEWVCMAAVIDSWAWWRGDACPLPSLYFCPYFFFSLFAISFSSFLSLPCDLCTNWHIHSPMRNARSRGETLSKEQVHHLLQAPFHAGSVGSWYEEGTIAVSFIKLLSTVAMSLSTFHCCHVAVGDCDDGRAKSVTGNARTFFLPLDGGCKSVLLYANE